MNHICNWVLFLLLLHLYILSGVISPLISSSILGTYWPGEFIFQCSIFCLFILFMGFSRQETEVVCHSLLQWTTFCQNSPPWPDHLGWPYMAWFSFMALDKAVVHVIRLAIFLWLWFQSVYPQMPSLSTYHLSGGFSYLGLGVSLRAAPDVGLGVSPHGHCFWPWTWGISSQPSLLTLDMGYLLLATRHSSTAV